MVCKMFGEQAQAPAGGKITVIKAILVLLALTSFAMPVQAAQKAAVLPFEIIQQPSKEDFFFIPQEKEDPVENERLENATQQMKDLMRASGKYEIVELNGMGKEIEDASPLYKCRCEAGFGKKVGADVVVSGIFEKVSESLTRVTVREHDTSSGKLTRSMRAVMQGNTDLSWQNVVKWIAKNRLLKAKTKEQE